MKPEFFSRDISWLSFNKRVLQESLNENLLLGERLKFLSIFSSNLDEFYRVRMPVIAAKHLFALNKNATEEPLKNAVSEFDEAKKIIQQQLEQYGDILINNLIPALEKQSVQWLYNKQIPEWLTETLRHYFFSDIIAFLEINHLKPGSDFFPENNKLYLFVSFEDVKKHPCIINIPSDKLPRFFSIEKNGQQYIVFIDDIIRNNLSHLFCNKKTDECFSFKITRDAELNLKDELPHNLAEKIEKQIVKRDLGKATRLLHQGNIPLRQLQLLCDKFKISLSNTIKGGTYHNLKDIMSLPLPKTFFDASQPAINLPLNNTTLHELILQKDIMLHSPFNNYETVLRFFNEAVIDSETEEIFVTFYRVAEDSKIAHALISAAKNGKKVVVFDELKARFDEANNLMWAKKMKEAGVKVIYSIPNLKVHAKVALIKKKNGKNVALLATGNMNESTARFYTDLQLFTAHAGIIKELKALFHFLDKRKIPGKEDELKFDHLFVAQFNLKQQFLALVDNEIENKKKGLSACIYIKLNNLEEKTLIEKLYEASCAGVTIRLIVRSVCCLIPGVAGISENITIKRIVGKYLEHSRVFVFHNNGDIKVFAGSADWMNRNIHTRIEVCFPVYDKALKNELLQIIALQLNDNVQGVFIDADLNNVPVVIHDNEQPVDSQKAIHMLLKEKATVYEMA